MRSKRRSRILRLGPACLLCLNVGHGLPLGPILLPYPRGPFLRGGNSLNRNRNFNEDSEISWLSKSRKADSSSSRDSAADYHSRDSVEDSDSAPDDDLNLSSSHSYTRYLNVNSNSNPNSNSTFFDDDTIEENVKYGVLGSLGFLFLFYMYAHHTIYWLGLRRNYEKGTQDMIGKGTNWFK